MLMWLHLCDSIYINVTKIFHMNFHVWVMHINWNYEQIIIKLWNPTTK